MRDKLETTQYYELHKARVEPTRGSFPWSGAEEVTGAEGQREDQPLYSSFPNVELIEGHKESVAFYDTNYKAFSIDCQNKKFPLTIKVESKAIRTTLYFSTFHNQPTSTNCTHKYVVTGTKLLTFSKAVAEWLHVAVTISTADQGLLSIVNL